MNEFELLRQLRGLREPVAPHRDLWSGIESRITQPGRNRALPRRRRRWPLALAASLVIGVLSSLALVSMRMEPAGNTSNAISSAQGDSVRERIERAKLRAAATRAWPDPKSCWIRPSTNSNPPCSSNRTPRSWLA